MLTPMKRLLFAIVLLSAARTAAARGMLSETFAVTETAVASTVSMLSAEATMSAVSSVSAETAASAVCLPKLLRRIFVRFSRKPPYPLFLRPQVISSGPAFLLLLRLPHPPRRLPPLRLLPTDGPLRFLKNWLRDSVRWALTE